VAFRKELDTLTRKYAIRIEYLLSDQPLRGRLGSEWLQPRHLAALVPDLAEREVFLCGPEGMVRYVKDTLDALGVQDARIHTEVFVF
jgi:ferredoxin-NADP reductase